MQKFPKRNIKKKYAEVSKNEIEKNFKKSSVNECLDNFNFA